jgi:hypothetical protein
MGLPDDNPSSFGYHYMAFDVMLGWRDLQAVGKIWHILSNFSAQNLLQVPGNDLYFTTGD